MGANLINMALTAKKFGFIPDGFHGWILTNDY